jgi:hypothetical protein
MKKCHKIPGSCYQFAYKKSCFLNSLCWLSCALCKSVVVVFLERKKHQKEVGCCSTKPFLYLYGFHLFHSHISSHFVHLLRLLRHSFLHSFNHVTYFFTINTEWMLIGTYIWDAGKSLGCLRIFDSRKLRYLLRA